MANNPIVAGWRGAKFGNVDFAKYVVRWQDTRERQGVVHRYIKRDGGEAEDMGRAPHKAVVNLVYIGQTWRDDFLALQSAIDDKPIDTLTHPIYGAMTAWAHSSAGAMDIENTPNMYELTLSFEESQVDTNVSATQQASAQGPQAQGQNISTAIAAVASYSPLFLTAATALTNLTLAAAAYSSAALASSQSVTVDPTLPQQLANILILANSAQSALAVDPAAAPGIIDPAQFAVESLYDACTQMADAIAALRPVLSLYTIPQTMTLLAWSQQFYGPLDGPSREAEIYMNNPGSIPDPGFIAQGTALWMAPPTYKR